MRNNLAIGLLFCLLVVWIPVGYVIALVMRGIEIVGRIRRGPEINLDYAGLHDDGGVLYCDGLEDAFIGFASRFHDGPLAAYDQDIIIKRLMEDGMDEDEAFEFFTFNIEGAWVGDRTPVFVTLTEGR